MTKIAFIGAGSLGFTAGLVRDILTFPLLEDAQIALMDIDAERLDFAHKTVQKLIQAGKYPARVTATLDRVEALRDADVVLTTILTGTTDVWKYDIEIPKKYGVDINVGDTRGPSGIFRFLRTLPPMLDILHTMEEVCPNAVWLNYTNPMAMLCGALQRITSIPVTGLCHSVQGTAMMLADWIGVQYSDVNYLCAGINHQAWYLKYEVNGRDAYPQIHKAITENPEIYNEEQVRNEMYLALGYYVTESSGHNSEYNCVVPQAPRPDREILHPRHRLESRRICLHPEGIPEDRGHLEGWRAGRAGQGSHRQRPGARAGVCCLHHQCPAKAASPSNSTATCPIPACSPTCPRAPAWRCRSTWTRPASIRCTSGRCRPSAPC